MQFFKPRARTDGRTRSGLMTAFYLYIVVCLAIAGLRLAFPDAPHAVHLDPATHTALLH